MPWLRPWPSPWCSKPCPPSLCKPQRTIRQSNPAGLTLAYSPLLLTHGRYYGTEDSVTDWPMHDHNAKYPPRSSGYTDSIRQPVNDHISLDSPQAASLHPSHDGSGDAAAGYHDAYYNKWGVGVASVSSLGPLARPPAVRHRESFQSAPRWQAAYRVHSPPPAGTLQPNPEHPQNQLQLPRISRKLLIRTPLHTALCPCLKNVQAMRCAHLFNGAVPS